MTLGWRWLSLGRASEMSQWSLEICHSRIIYTIECWQTATNHFPPSPKNPCEHLPAHLWLYVQILPRIWWLLTPRHSCHRGVKFLAQDCLHHSYSPNPSLPPLLSTATRGLGCSRWTMSRPTSSDRRPSLLGPSYSQTLTSASIPVCPLFCFVWAALASWHSFNTARASEVTPRVPGMFLP